MARQRRISVAAAVGLGVLAPLVLAGTASAHTHHVTVACDKLTVDLNYYSADRNNTVSLVIGTQKVLDHQKFGGSFHQEFPVPAHTADLTATLTVVTDEDPKGTSGWTFTETDTIKPCPVTPSPSPSVSSSTPTPSPSASHSASPTPTPTHTPSPSATGPVLASTGGGSNAGLIAGLGVGVIAVGGGVLVVTRRRSARRH